MNKLTDEQVLSIATYACGYEAAMTNSIFSTVESLSYVPAYSALIRDVECMLNSSTSIDACNKYLQLTLHDDTVSVIIEYLYTV